jgi:hypothetical protein
VGEGGRTSRRWLAAIGVLAVAVVVGLVASSVGDEPDWLGSRTDVHRFEHDAVPFTFDYPASFAPVAEADLPEGFLAVLGVGPVSFIDVRRTTDGELTHDQIVTTIGPALTTEGTAVLSYDTRDLDGGQAVTFLVADRGRPDLTVSRLTFVGAGGSTWELGCQASKADAATINAACEQALTTFRRLDAE